MKTIGRITLMLVVVTVLMCSASGAHGQTISFVAAPAFPAGTSPTSVATGVLTGSGRPDVAVTNQHGVLILLNDGSGGMAPGNSYAAGTNPQSVVIDDFDGNGKNDLAVVNQGSGTVSIFLGNGDGSFVPGAAYAAGVNPRLVLTGDLNNDGKRDLVVVDSGAGPGTSGVSILLGNGDGSFRPASFVALGSVSISATIGDFNGDGKPISLQPMRAPTVSPFCSEMAMGPSRPPSVSASTSPASAYRRLQLSPPTSISMESWILPLQLPTCTMSPYCWGMAMARLGRQSTTPSTILTSLITSTSWRPSTLTSTATPTSFWTILVRTM